MPFPTITTTQQFTITLKPLTGSTPPKPATVDGDPVWASSNEAVATVTPIPGTLSADVKAQGVGGYSVSANADADLGAGVRTITFQDTGDVTLGEAATMSAEFGPVTEQA